MGDNTEQQPSTAIVRRVPNTLAVMSDGEINRSWRLAEGLAQSGAFPDPEDGKMTPALAFATMLVGHDLGLSPTRALMSIDIVKGRPRINSVALAGFIKASGRYTYRIVEHDAEKCSIDFFEVPPSRPGARVLLGNSTFTIEEAKQQGLVKKTRTSKDGMWEKVPKNMLFARALSNGCKWHCPDAMGGVPVYTEGDSFEERPALSAGSGDGGVQGLDLGVKVEKVIARAEGLGHAALSDRAAIEMALGGRSPEVAATWAREAEVELNALAEGAMAEAEIVEPTPAERIRRAQVLREEAEKETDTTVAEGLRQRAHIEEGKAAELTMDGKDVPEQLVKDVVSDEG